MKSYFKHSLLCIAATLTASGAFAQEDVLIEEFGGPGNVGVELVKVQGQVKETLERVTPVEPHSVPIPKFALTTKNKKFIMTIGGAVNPVLGTDLGNDLYDTSAGASFVTSDIPTAVPGKKSDIYLVGVNGCIHWTMVGFAGTPNEITAFVKIGTNGNNANVGLSRAWLSWRGFTMGQRLTFIQDGYACQPPTIDPQGPCGDLSTISQQLYYTLPKTHNFSFALGAMIPTYYYGNGVYRGKDYPVLDDKIVDTFGSQAIPDFGAWLEYQVSPQRRIRLTGLLRNFSYQDKYNNGSWEPKRRYKPGYGVMLSGNFDPVQQFTLYVQCVYGRGIGSYLQDIAGKPISYTNNPAKPGYMRTTPMMGLMFGASFNPTKKLQFNAIWSKSRVWNMQEVCTALAETDAMNDYRGAQYVAANVFYNYTSYLQFGLEYLWGQRQTWANGRPTDNRIQAQVQFSF